MDQENDLRKNLEIEKLKIDIKNSKKSIFSQPGFYSALSTMIVSAIAMYYTIQTGFFERESKILELKKENLRYEINNFEEQRDSLLLFVKTLQEEKNKLTSQKDYLIKENRNLNNLSTDLLSQQDYYQRQLESYKNSVVQYSTELDSIKDKYKKLNDDRVLLADKMIELKIAVDSNLDYDENIQIIYDDILKILDKNLGGFSSKMLLLFDE